MSDEFVDILDQHGKHTGEVKLKSEAHRIGLYHGSVHIWFYTKDGEVLIQKRAKNKDTFPNLWDISVAGHISAGETPEKSALREIREEIGVAVSLSSLEFLDTFLAEKKPKPDILDNEFHYIYLSKKIVSLKEVSLQKEEVSDIKLISIKKLNHQLSDRNASEKYVPHGKKYFNLVLNAIQERLNT